MKFTPTLPWKQDNSNSQCDYHIECNLETILACVINVKFVHNIYSRMCTTVHQNTLID